ncbi:hypothetical protein [Hoeflea olei]|uniref:Uncharacterized protein n=1 Tax=Hoeflea olei TaxID=1480615 RepID=A0A1C1YRU9_9HYPH|nr:hypothetical protein [Hoeflea olei]OCW56272.1 hypothetical protein AWJ14_19450 [Hoeflea olei]
MPVLNLNEDERGAVVAALHHERVRLTGEWSKAFDDEEGSVIYRDNELERLAKAIDLTTDLRRKVEVAADITKSAWHNEYGWLHPVKSMEAAIADYESGEATREDVADALGIDVAELDAANARDRARQDQIAPGTWTTLPEGYDVDADPYEVTDPEEPKVKRIEIKIDGVTRTVYSTDRNIEELERALVDLQIAQRAYLDGCVSEMVS